MAHHVLILSWFPDESRGKQFRDELPDDWTSDFFRIPFGPLQPGTVPDDIWAKTTILLSHTALPQTEMAPNLQWIHLAAAGVDHVANHPVIKNTTIPVTTVSGIHGPPIAEWVAMSTLVLAKEYRTYYERQKARQFVPSVADRVKDRDWVRKRVGILGYGSIGRQIANVFRAMGSEIHAFTASPRVTPESRVDRGYVVPGTGDPDGTIPAAWHSGLDKKSLHAFLGGGFDMVVMCLPLTPLTRHLFGEEELRLLGPRCIFVNIARGSIVDQLALVRALNEGVIAGAALDVTSPEPLPADDALWTAKNVIISPHVSAISAEYATRAMDVAVANLARFLKGDKLINELSRERGY